MDMVKAWNGKWHIFEDDLPPQPAVPDRGVFVYPPCDKPEGQVGTDGKWGYFHRKASCFDCRNAGRKVVRKPLPQPEREQALTSCGLEVMVKSRLTVDWFLLGQGPESRSYRLCTHCKPVFLRRMM